MYLKRPEKRGSALKLQRRAAAFALATLAATSCTISTKKDDDTAGGGTGAVIETGGSMHVGGGGTGDPEAGSAGAMPEGGGAGGESGNSDGGIGAGGAGAAGEGEAGASGAGECSTNPAQTEWDVLADYSTVSNPCGVWSYGYKDNLNSAFILETASTTNGEWSSPGVASTWHNASTGTYYNIAPGQVAIHPGESGQYMTIRWTAPRHGTFAFNVKYFVGDAINSTSKEAAILHAGQVIFEEPTSTNPTYSTTLTMPAGDTFDVGVGLAADQVYYYGNTGLIMTVTQQ